MKLSAHTHTHNPNPISMANVPIVPCVLSTNTFCSNVEVVATVVMTAMYVNILYSFPPEHSMTDLVRDRADVKVALAATTAMAPLAGPEAA